MSVPQPGLVGLLSAFVVMLPGHLPAAAPPPAPPLAHVAAAPGPAEPSPAEPGVGQPSVGGPGLGQPGVSGPSVGQPGADLGDDGPLDPSPAIIAPSDPGPPDAVPPDPGPPAQAVRGPNTGWANGDAKDAGDLGNFFGNALTWIDHGAFGLDRARLVRDRTAPTGRLLRVTYPAGSASPEAARNGAKSGGAQSYLRLRHSADVMTLSYSVRFQPGFRFVKGGKLPGLFGGDAGSGGHHEKGGFSTRFMWRAGGAGEVYAYLPNEKGYGASLGRGRWRFTPGRWVRVAQRVVLNAPGRNNGTITVWVNGRQVFSQGGLVYRNDGDVHIDGLFFSSFFGGSDSSWASPNNQYADFARFNFVPLRAPGPGGL